MKVRDKNKTGNFRGCDEAFTGSFPNLGVLIGPAHSIKQLLLYKGKESRSACCVNATWFKLKDKVLGWGGGENTEGGTAVSLPEAFLNNSSLEQLRCTDNGKADSRLPSGSAEDVFWVSLRALGKAGKPLAEGLMLYSADSPEEKHGYAIQL